MLIKTYGSAVYGVNAQLIIVEVNIDKGIGYQLVGLPDNAIKESAHRISAALKKLRIQNAREKITVNMAPADLRKEGSAYDLTIAMGILAASEQIKCEHLQEYLIMGELSLDGSLQPIKGVLPIAIQARQEGYKRFFLPKQNAKEAAIVNELTVYAVENIKEVIDFFDKGKALTPSYVNTREEFFKSYTNHPYDFSEVKGQENVKRALEIAAAGGHNVLLIGPPGSGKTMLAKRLPSILPPLTLSEALETTKIHSVAGKLGNESSLMTVRPYRNPHHTISGAALVGGGTYPQPGEISLSHNGVLFLDELPEFNRQVLEVLRQPLEDRMVTISRTRFTVTYPSSFMLIASMNPSPSGYFPDDPKNTSSIQEMQRYMNKISGPLLDRFDIHIEVSPVAFDDLSEKEKGESSEAIRDRVIKARELQTIRYNSIEEIHYNSQIGPKQLDDFCGLNEDSKKLLKKAIDKLGLSARAYDRILRVGRTIADLDESEEIGSYHIAEAIQYRSLDRNHWGV